MAGVAVFGIGIWTILWKLQYASLLTTITYVAGTYALTVAGAVAIIGGILGCCGVFYEQRAVILCVSNRCGVNVSCSEACWLTNPFK